VSVVETRASVTVRIGDPTTPATLRFRLRDRPAGAPAGEGVEEEVLQAAPTDLDAALAAVDPGALAPENGDVAAILEWGPREEPLRALLVRAAAARGEERAGLLRRLAARAEAWDREEGVPATPRPGGDDAEAALRLWARWYRDVIGVDAGLLDRDE
jgi:hypothetical protein